MFRDSLIVGLYKAQVGIYLSLDQVWASHNARTEWIGNHDLSQFHRSNTYRMTFMRIQFDSEELWVKAALDYKAQFEHEIDIGEKRIAHAELIREEVDENNRFIHVEMFLTERGRLFMKAHEEGYFFDFSGNSFGQIDYDKTELLMRHLLKDVGETHLLHEMFRKQRDPRYKELTNRYMLNKLAGKYVMR